MYNSNMAVRAPKKKNPAAVALGRKGGKKGGLARAAKLSPEERSEIARKAVRARWAKATAKGQRTTSTLDAQRRTRSAKPTATPDTSDRAVLALLQRIKATEDRAEIRKLSNELERLIFHKQYRTA